jgi:hypothetical protein
MIVPDAPAAQHVVVLTHATAVNPFAVPDVCADHVTPPFVLATTVPNAPAAMQSLASAHETPARAAFVPDV